VAEKAAWRLTGVKRNESHRCREEERDIESVFENRERKCHPSGGGAALRQSSIITSPAYNFTRRTLAGKAQSGGGGVASGAAWLAALAAAAQSAQ